MCVFLCVCAGVLAAAVRVGLGFLGADAERDHLQRAGKDDIIIIIPMLMMMMIMT